MRFQSKRNYGYGRSLVFAAKTALREMYFVGHYGTVKTHCEKWNKFVSFAREIGISDAREIDQEILDAFLRRLKEQVEAGTLAVSYAVNIASSVNTVLLAFRGNRKIRLVPSQIGTISTVRTRAPGYMSRDRTMSIVEALENAGFFGEAAMVRLGGDNGFRLKEAGLYRTKPVALSARKTGVIAVEKGTKGGQRRIVPIKSEEQFSTLNYAREHQTGGSFIPDSENYAAFRLRVYRIFRKFGVYGHLSFRELRAAYACNEYLRLTGYQAPVLGGAAPPEVDKAARLQIAKQLGHHRIGVTASYFGKLLT